MNLDPESAPLLYSPVSMIAEPRATLYNPVRGMLALCIVLAGAMSPSAETTRIVRWSQLARDFEPPAVGSRVAVKPLRFHENVEFPDFLRSRLRSFLEEQGYVQSELESASHCLLAVAATVPDRVLKDKFVHTVLLILTTPTQCEDRSRIRRLLRWSDTQQKPGKIGNGVLWKSVVFLRNYDVDAGAADDDQIVRLVSAVVDAATDLFGRAQAKEELDLEW